MDGIPRFCGGKKESTKENSSLMDPWLFWEKKDEKTQKKTQEGSRDKIRKYPASAGKKNLQKKYPVRPRESGGGG